jgi:hypothetical protein
MKVINKTTYSFFCKQCKQFMEPEGSIPNSQELSTCPYLSQTNPVHITPSHLYKIHPNIIQPPMPWSS